MYNLCHYLNYSRSERLSVLFQFDQGYYQIELNSFSYHKLVTHQILLPLSFQVSPIEDYTIVEVVRGNTKTVGYIRVTGINTQTSYMAIVNLGIGNWKQQV